MKRNPYLLILHTALAVLLIATAAACSDDDPSDAPVPDTDGTSPDATNLVTVRFSSGDDATPETRTTIGSDGKTVKWNRSSDNIGISAVRTDNPDGTKVENKLYNPATSAVNSTFTPDGGEEMQLDNGGTYTFTSYYPWKSGATADKVTAVVDAMKQTNGTTSNHIGLYDFMWARKEDVPISGTESPQVSFNYKHIFPMLVFKIESDGTKEVKCISVRSADGTTPVRGNVSVSLADGTIGQVTSGKYYTSLTFSTPMTDNGTGRLLILPQAAGAELIIGVLTTDNVLYEYTKIAANALEGGKSYPFTFDLKTGNVPNRTVYTAAGTNTDWQIADESGLRGFALAVNYYGQANASATLTANIELSNYAAWEESIGINTTIAYKGIFNGGGYTVSGLAINRTSGNNVGLFGYLTNATVQNLRVTGNVTATASEYVGGIAGQVAGSNAVIENCLFAGSVTGSLNVGGIVGYNSGGGITACFSSGSVTAKSGNAGGITGYNSGSTITHCYSSAAVTTEESIVGGIAGYNARDGKVTSCYATGTVSAKNSGGGGIAGENNSSTLENCLALGSAVTRTSDNSTSFGRVAGNNYGTITNCAAWEGMTLPFNVTEATENGKDGANLTTDECKKKDAYTATRGFDDPRWSFDDQSPWQSLPWIKAFENFSGLNEADYRLAVPTK